MHIGFKINGITYNRTTNAQGSASVPINLNPGKYIITISFNGSSNYSATSKNVTVNVLSLISGENVTKYFKNDTQYTATFLNNQGKVLTNSKVNFNINGIFYNRITDSKGMAKLNINLPAGKYILTAINPNGFQYSNIIKVLPTIIAENITQYIEDKKILPNQNDQSIQATPIDIDKNTVPANTIRSNTIYYNDGNCHAKFLNGNGNALILTKVNFNINGIIYNRTTDLNGMASLDINLPVGEYILTAYNPNNNFCLSNTVKVVKRIGTSLESENITTTQGIVKLNATLTDNSGNKLSNKTIYLNIFNCEKTPEIINGTLYLDIDNKILSVTNYTTTTHNNGTCSFEVNLTNGTPALFFAFSGDSEYGPSHDITIATVLNKQ